MHWSMSKAMATMPASSLRSEGQPPDCRPFTVAALDKCRIASVFGAREVLLGEHRSGMGSRAAASWLQRVFRCRARACSRPSRIRSSPNSNSSP
jgi:hypothetical protein